jgi:hypothetical protein
MNLVNLIALLVIVQWWDPPHPHGIFIGKTRDEEHGTPVTHADGPITISLQNAKAPVKVRFLTEDWSHIRAITRVLVSSLKDDDGGRIHIGIVPKAGHEALPIEGEKGGGDAERVFPKGIKRRPELRHFHGIAASCCGSGTSGSGAVVSAAKVGLTAAVKQVRVRTLHSIRRNVTAMSMSMLFTILTITMAITEC